MSSSNFGLEDIGETMNRSSLYEINISQKLGKEYVGMFNDIARFVMIQIGIQTMLYTMDPERFSLISSDFLMLLMFIMIGVSFYWLIFKKFITFK